MRGLLQGSTLSPILFNFFINELVAELEMGEGGLMVWEKVVKALFFADDGALLAYDDERMAAMLDTCPLQLYGIDLPSTTNSLYLGFPFTHRGIDWKALATERCEKARKVVAGMRDQRTQNFALRTIFSGPPNTSIHALHRVLAIPMFKFRAQELNRIGPVYLPPPIEKAQRRQRRVASLTARTKVTRELRVSISRWQLGMVASHQDCSRCGGRGALSREHAVDCAEAEEVLEGMIPGPDEAAITRIEERCRGRSRTDMGFYR